MKPLLFCMSISGRPAVPGRPAALPCTLHPISTECVTPPPGALHFVAPFWLPWAHLHIPPPTPTPTNAPPSRLDSFLTRPLTALGSPLPPLPCPSPIHLRYHAVPVSTPSFPPLHAFWGVAQRGLVRHRRRAAAPLLALASFQLFVALRCCTPARPLPIQALRTTSPLGFCWGCHRPFLPLLPPSPLHPSQQLLSRAASVPLPYHTLCRALLGSPRKAAAGHCGRRSPDRFAARYSENSHKKKHCAAPTSRERTLVFWGCLSAPLSQPAALSICPRPPPPLPPSRPKIQSHSTCTRACLCCSRRPDFPATPAFGPPVLARFTCPAPSTAPQSACA